MDENWKEVRREQVTYRCYFRGRKFAGLLEQDTWILKNIVREMAWALVERVRELSKKHGVGCKNVSNSKRPKSVPPTLWAVVRGRRRVHQRRIIVSRIV